MQYPAHFRFRRPVARTAIAALTFTLVWLVGAATAQQADRPGTEDTSQQPFIYISPLPEPPTEHVVAPVLDAANPDHGRLQQPQEAFSILPADKLGRPDWVRALREGLIRPRSSVAGDEAMQSLDLDILMKNTAQMPFVKFPHQAHSAWLDCSNCHDAIFAPKTGANTISMSQILRGESCGVCHTKVAFSVMACERCHSVLQPGQDAWW